MSYIIKTQIVYLIEDFKLELDHYSETEYDDCWTLFLSTEKLRLYDEKKLDTAFPVPLI